MTKFLLNFTPCPLFSQTLNCLDYLRFPPGDTYVQIKAIKKRQVWLSPIRTAITYHIQTVYIPRYWSPDGCWPHSDMCRCPFCWAWLWLIPCPPRSYAQRLAALLHLWTTAPGPVWETNDKHVFVSYIWWLCKCYVMTLSHEHTLYSISF